MKVIFFWGGGGGQLEGLVSLAVRISSFTKLI